MTIRTILLGPLVGSILLTGCGSHAWQARKQAQVIATRSTISSTQAEPSNIVLMLPLKGKIAASSQAIRNGFLAAYYHSRKNNHNINIKIIDTTDDNIPTLYHQATLDGAEVVVGPLTKQDVATIMGIDPLPIPVLALNTLDDYTHNFASNLYQFGLLPQDEALQVATNMLENYHNQAAVIAPANSWGKKIVAAFKNRYEKNGGKVVDILSYDPTLNLAQQICPFIAEDAAELCNPKNKDKKKEKNPESEDNRDQDQKPAPTRRQDINTIFLVASADIARQIIPLLKFYYAGDLPIYATSEIYTGNLAPNLDQDIDNVQFCDLPLILQQPTELPHNLQIIHKQILTLWPKSYTNHKRLYALGIDAYTIATNLNGFLNSPQYGFQGATGTLYLDNFNRIYRELLWAKMQHGVPNLLE